MKKIILSTAFIFLILFSSIQTASTTYSNQSIETNVSTYTVQLITIYNPYEDIDFDSINHYKANLHTHTTNSDGSSSPAEVIYQYHDVGDYDILAITDHNRNTWSWSDYINETPIESSPSSEYYPSLNMLAISGNEMSLRHHRNSLLNDYFRGGFFINQAFRYIQEQNGLSFFNHPGRYNHRVQWYQRFFDQFDDVIVGIEVFNQGDRYDQDRILWDEINKEREPDDLIWGLSNDDMHDISDHIFRNYDYFLMNELTETEFRTAMVSGAFYFCYEPNGADNQSPTYGIAITPKLTRVTVNENSIVLTCNDCETIEWINQESTVIQYGSEIDVSLVDSNFVRAVLSNEYGKTFTQPFGILKTNSEIKLGFLDALFHYPLADSIFS